MMASCSSWDFRAKFAEDTINTPRSWRFFKTSIPSLISSISRKFCVDVFGIFFSSEG